MVWSRYYIDMDKQQYELASTFNAFGFSLFGIQPIGPSITAPQLKEWLDADMHGSMQWMEREDTVAKRQDPQRILPGAKQVISVAFQYTPGAIPEEMLNDPSRGIIARYALYDDYHDVIKKKLHQLAAALQEQYGAFEYKAYVDTGPFLEREWAQRAGLGFIGRNSNLIHYHLGSYLFIAELLITAELPEYTQESRGSCARCTNCVDQCPTQAIVADGTIDARRCISYLTIENRGPIPEWARPLMGNRIYGCDICQEVCPYNARVDAQEKVDFQVRSEFVAPPLSELLFFDDESFRAHFRNSPIKRAKREGWMRNVTVAIGNWLAAEPESEAKELLQKIIEQDPSALVREHAEWALAEYTT